LNSSPGIFEFVAVTASIPFYYAVKNIYKNCPVVLGNIGDIAV
jgi:hypothetical protein